MSNTAAISVRLPEWRDLYKATRSNLEWIGAALGGASLLLWRGPIGARFASGEWNADAYVSAIFDWSSIQGAFLFGVYAFFLSRSEPFLQAISGSPAFRDLRRYVVRTLYLTMALTVGSLPFLVDTPAVRADGGGFGFMVLWSLSVVLIFTFFSFLKVIRVFGKIDRRS